MTLNEKFEEKAKQIVNEWDFDCSAVFSTLDKISQKEMLIEAVIQALKEERAQAVVDLKDRWPSLSEVLKQEFFTEKSNEYEMKQGYTHDWLVSLAVQRCIYAKLFEEGAE